MYASFSLEDIQPEIGDVVCEHIHVTVRLRIPLETTLVFLNTTLRACCTKVLAGAELYNILYKDIDHLWIFIDPDTEWTDICVPNRAPTIRIDCKNIHVQDVARNCHVPCPGCVGPTHLPSISN
jgi:hypothetical protein